MFEPFSSSYLIGRFYLVSAHEEASAVTMPYAEYEQAFYEYYRGTGPLVMRVKNRHFPVYGASDVPHRSISMPDAVLADIDVSSPPILTEVLLAKNDIIANTFNFQPPTPPVDTESYR